MKAFCALVLISLTLPALQAKAEPAKADCKSEIIAVLDAMRAAGPMRRQSQFYLEGKLINKTVSDFNPPDQLHETAQSDPVSIVIVSGKTAWSIIKRKGQPDQPATQFDGSLFLIDAAKYQLPEDLPLVDCKTDDAGLMQIVWTKSDGKKTLEVTAQADAKTHMLKSVDSQLTRKDGSIESDKKSSFTPIAAFTVMPPENSVKYNGGPTYAKLSDVDPAIPMPPDADKITYSKPAHLVRYSSPQKLAALMEFYRNKYQAMGWKEEYTKSKDTSFETQFVNDKKDWVRLQLDGGDQVTNVTLNGPYERK